MDLEELRTDCAIKQKMGLHFILASVIIWALVLCIQVTHLPALTKNLFVFCCTALLLPVSYLIAKVIRADFENKDNPLTKLGVLLSANQILYLLIAMWIYPTIPEKMLMVIAIIFGAHLLPYSWLYRSKVYMVMAVLISIGALVIGLTCEAWILAACMIATETAFSVLLSAEVRKLAEQHSSHAQ